MASCSSIIPPREDRWRVKLGGLAHVCVSAEEPVTVCDTGAYATLQPGTYALLPDREPPQFPVSLGLSIKASILFLFSFL